MVASALFITLLLTLLIPVHPLAQSTPRPKSSFPNNSLGRRAVFLTTVAAPVVTLPFVASALVPGALPPPPKKKVVSGERTCKTIDECLEQQEKKEREAAGDVPQVEVFSSAGVRFIRLKGGDEESEGLKDGDSTSIKFNVLKAGKRSADGLSGQGTSIFSMGYMVEDDEKPNSTFSFSTSDSNVIEALKRGVLGMGVNEVRRLQVLPVLGWRKIDRGGDGGPGGSGAGGEVGWGEGWSEGTAFIVYIHFSACRCAPRACHA